ncbi:MAG: hypothetical protein GY822_27055 [Deltaproteobacteria bacterium]|nr:hypothetical protein [Deltaproteobacteria bacterium]
MRIDKTAPDLQSRQPGTLRLAVAYAERRSFTISMDLIFYPPTSHRLIPEEDIRASQEVLSRIPLPLQIRRSPIMNANIGVEKMLTPKFSISAGLFTNYSSAPNLTVQDGYYRRQSATFER